MQTYQSIIKIQLYSLNSSINYIENVDQEILILSLNLMCFTMCLLNFINSSYSKYSSVPFIFVLNLNFYIIIYFK